MEPETEEKRVAREARLEALCEPLGLVADGSTVRLKDYPDGPVLDASAIDHNQIVPHLVLLAYQAGQQQGDKDARAEIRAKAHELAAVLQ